MIDLELTDDHEALVQTVREFAQKEVAPYIKEWDEKQEFHPEVFHKMAELNLLGVCIPEEYGGAGFDYISLGLVCEELEAVDTFLRVAMSVHTGLNSLTLYTWGTEAQKQKYLVPQAKGEQLATYGLTEPGAGSDVVAARSTARREGDEYVLNGEKMWISLADTADNFLFFCWTDEEKRRNRDHTGMSCFIVERTMKGIHFGNDSWEARHPRRQHRIFFFAGRARTERKPDRRRRRGLQDRDVRPRAGKIHGGRGRNGSDSSFPRCVRRLRERTGNLRH